MWAGGSAASRAASQLKIQSVNMFSQYAEEKHGNYKGKTNTASCRRENMVAAPGGHAASRNDLEICLTSMQDQSILRIPKGVPVNLTCN